MRKFKHIMWDPKYSVHNEVIDIQHKEFFSIFNRLVDLHESGSIDVDSILRDLVQFVSEQFHTEHLFMRETNYPDFLQHSMEHDIFIEAVQVFLNRYEKYDEQLVYDMLIFLNDWISLHILKTDLRYGEHLVLTRDEGSQPTEEEIKPIKELRRTPRIVTLIETYYWKRGLLDIFGKVQKGTVHNLSLRGCCLLTKKSHMIDLHSKIHLVFKLDNNHRTKIEREAVVFRVTDKHIGCRFTSDVHGYEPQFVSYINEHIAIQKYFHRSGFRKIVYRTSS
jgi:hemerythrin